MQEPTPRNDKEKVTRTTRRPAGRPKGKGSEHIRRTLMLRILNGELPPDTTLDETELSKEFRVSRTPLREALIHLASDGYVELTPNRSPRVTPLPVSGLAPCYEALELAGRILARWAAVRRSDNHLEEMETCNRLCAQYLAEEDYLAFIGANHRFHMTIARAGANDYFAKAFEEALITSQRYANAIVFPDPFRKSWERAQYESVVEDHAGLIAAIRDGDATTAERLTQKHIRSFRDRVLDHFYGDDRTMPLVLDDNEKLAS
jgi:DNA-binding GntR family transcriptional regulator